MKFRLQVQKNMAKLMKGAVSCFKVGRGCKSTIFVIFCRLWKPLFNIFDNLSHHCKKAD